VDYVASYGKLNSRDEKIGQYEKNGALATSISNREIEIYAYPKLSTDDKNTMRK